MRAIQQVFDAQEQLRKYEQQYKQALRQASAGVENNYYFLLYAPKRNNFAKSEIQRLHEGKNFYHPTFTRDYFSLAFIVPEVNSHTELEVWHVLSFKQVFEFKSLDSWQVVFTDSQWSLEVLNPDVDLGALLNNMDKMSADEIEQMSHDINLRQSLQARDSHQLEFFLKNSFSEKSMGEMVRSAQAAIEKFIEDTFSARYKVHGDQGATFEFEVAPEAHVKLKEKISKQTQAIGIAVETMDNTALLSQMEHQVNWRDLQDLINMCKNHDQERMQSLLTPGVHCNKMRPKL